MTTPEPTEGFDVAEFVTGPNTLYMIGGSLPRRQSHMVATITRKVSTCR